jgi:hypothetical protein
MKKKLLNPSFDFVFALGIISMLLLPPMVMAQQPPKQLKVIIENNDTTINGKNIKDLSATERKKALKDMAEVSKDNIISSTGDVNGVTGVTYIRGRVGAETKGVRVEHDGAGDKHIQQNFSFKMDTAEHHWTINTNDINARGAKFAQGFRFYNDDKKNEHRMMRMGREGKRNSQSFNYANTNKDGFSTQISYNASDVNPETAKRISGAEKPEISIDDLMLTPSFSTGKTNLSFSLPEKGSAEVLFKDSDGKVLWTDKTNGTFNKSFELPQNGIYYLQVKQGNKTGLRRIVKEH